MEFISKPMGAVLNWLTQLSGGNFALAVFIFTVIVNLVMLPLTIKSQKTTAKQAMIQPKLKKLKDKYGDDKMKYNQAMQELYQKENVSMSGGCLPMLIRLVFMMGVYWAVMKPLQYLCGVPAATVAAALGKSGREIDLIAKVAAGEVKTIPASVLDKVDFKFLGIDLTQTPHFTLNFSKIDILWLIPLLAFLAAMLTSVISLIIQKKTNPDAPNMMAMMLTTPLISLIFAFTLPGAVGFYWACSSLISGLTQAFAQWVYSPSKIIAKQQAVSIIKRDKKEKDIITNSKKAED